MSTLLEEILQEMELSVECSGGKECQCSHCKATKAAAPKQELFRMRVELPEEELLFESEAGSIILKLKNCLSKLNDISVLHSYRANEIVLELQYDIRFNKKTGDAFRDRIGDVMRNCLKNLAMKNARVQVESDRRGEKIIENVRQKGKRYIDVRIWNGRTPLMNIETKAGNSSYYPSQRNKDNNLQRNGRGPTYVVRDCSAGNMHPDCQQLRKATQKNITKEVTLLNELLQEFEI